MYTIVHLRISTSVTATQRTGQYCPQRDDRVWANVYCKKKNASARRRPCLSLWSYLNSVDVHVDVDVSRIYIHFYFNYRANPLRAADTRPCVPRADNYRPPRRTQNCATDLVGMSGDACARPHRARQPWSIGENQRCAQPRVHRCTVYLHACAVRITRLWAIIARRTAIIGEIINPLQRFSARASARGV